MELHQPSERSLFKSSAPTTTSPIPAQCVLPGTSASNGMAASALNTGVSDRKGTVRLNGESSTERMKSTFARAFMSIDASAGGQ